MADTVRPEVTDALDPAYGDTAEISTPARTGSFDLSPVTDAVWFSGVFQGPLPDR
jgi:hypothetical protein